jgi:hypothetical protein
VYLEAAAHGLPVVATKIGGIPEAVEDGVTGILVPPNDVPALTGALTSILRDDILRRTMGNKGKERVNNDFRWEERWERLKERLFVIPAKLVLDPDRGAGIHTRLREKSILVTSTDPRMDSRLRGNDKKERGNDKVSVIIPTWNHAKELMDCLSALEAQTYRDFEVIIVDDASTDNTREVVAGARTSFPLRYIRLDVNGGAPAARNRGAREATGSFLLFLDADVILRNDALQKMVYALMTQPDAAYAYSAFRFGWKRFVSESFSADALRDHPYIHTSSLMRRNAFPGFDESLKKFQDWDLWLSILDRGGKGVYIPEELYRVQVRNGGLSRWLPSIMHRIPWQRIGWMPDEIRKYREWEKVVKKKHETTNNE